MKTDIEGRWPCEDSGRDCRSAVTSQEMPGVTRRGKERLLPRSLRRSVALLTPSFGISGFENCERLHFYFKTPRCGTLLGYRRHLIQ